MHGMCPRNCGLDCGADHVGCFRKRLVHDTPLLLVTIGLGLAARFMGFVLGTVTFRVRIGSVLFTVVPVGVSRGWYSRSILACSLVL